MEPEIGDQLGHYRLVRLIGKGGMASVWEALNTGLKRPEAVKIIHEHRSNKDFIKRFHREAQTVAELIHPNIVGIHYISSEEETPPYFAMELISGESLSARLASLSHDEAVPSYLEETEVRDILAHVAAALDFAHEHGIVHRDIKPGNIMLGAAGVVKVVDFGIARAWNDPNAARLTDTGFMIGTARYLAPEQADRRNPVGPATDQYALAVTAYEMLTGCDPFDLPPRAEPITVVLAHLQQEPIPPQSRVPGISKAMNDAILKALSKDPKDRFASCDAFVQATLRTTPELVASLPAGATGSTSGEFALPSRKLRLLAVAVGLCFLASGSLLAYDVWGRNPERKGVPGVTSIPLPEDDYEQKLLEVKSRLADVSKDYDSYEYRYMQNKKQYSELKDSNKDSPMVNVYYLASQDSLDKMTSLRHSMDMILDEKKSLTLARDKNRGYTFFSAAIWSSLICFVVGLALSIGWLLARIKTKKSIA